MTIEPAYNFVFFNNDDKEIGTLSWRTGRFVFNGDADLSAKVFFEHLRRDIDSYIEYKMRNPNE